MKCDELKTEQWLDYSGEPMACYPKNDVDAAIAELKDCKDNWAKQCTRVTGEVLELKAENERLKAKLENVQASAYADSVDAGMHERKLRRALWLKRADDAKHLVIAYENYDYLDCQEMTIKQENARTWMTCKLRTSEEWVKVWRNVERKCLKKAEEYK